MLLFLEEEWVGMDGSLEVSSEKNLDVSGSFDVSGSKVRQLFPLSGERLVGNPISVFVNSSSFRFHIGRGLSFTTLFISSFDNSLGNIVVVLSSPNFTEKVELSSTGISSELFERLLQSVELLLSETDSGKLK